MKIAPIILLATGMAAVSLFMYLDRELSGASAKNTAYFIAFLFVGFIFILVIIFKDSNVQISSVASIFALSPFFLFIGGFHLTQLQWKYRPEAVERRAFAQNIRCATRAAGVTKADRPFVRGRINIISDHGDVNDQLLKAIEDRMGIRILPDCRFERLRNGAVAIY